METIATASHYFNHLRKFLLTFGSVDRVFHNRLPNGRLQGTDDLRSTTAGGRGADFVRIGKSLCRLDQSALR
jgi:hypothetical protein